MASDETYAQHEARQQKKIRDKYKQSRSGRIALAVAKRAIQQQLVGEQWCAENLATYFKDIIDKTLLRRSKAEG